MKPPPLGGTPSLLLLTVVYGAMVPLAGAPSGSGAGQGRVKNTSFPRPAI
jgi:hypothetical protein